MVTSLLGSLPASAASSSNNGATYTAAEVRVFAPVLPRASPPHPPLATPPHCVAKSSLGLPLPPRASPPHPSASSQVSLAPVLGARDAFVLDALSSACHLSSGRPAFLRVGAAWYAHDRRGALAENPLENPSTGPGYSAIAAEAPRPPYDGGAATCYSRVPQTFVNVRGCAQRSACGAAASSHLLVLNETSLRLFYELGGVLAYAVGGLRLESPFDVSPCAAGVSRWWRAEGACASETALDADTAIAIASALRVACARSRCGTMADIDVQSDGQTGAPCTSELNGVSATSASVTVDGACWTHSHPHEGNVYSFSYWAAVSASHAVRSSSLYSMPSDSPALRVLQAHPGNAVFTHNPIERPATSGATTIHLPPSHSMSGRWERARDEVCDRPLRRQMPALLLVCSRPQPPLHSCSQMGLDRTGVIGRLGDVVDFAQASLNSTPSHDPLTLPCPPIPIHP